MLKFACWYFKQVNILAVAFKLIGYTLPRIQDVIRRQELILLNVIVEMTKEKAIHIFLCED
ncbi:hypothetical protein BMI79_18235 [Serratia oryzae]|jgi:hypothetical protein|uniref:Uncharacterized protein n=1 Tax=Serratia oryzae TaxID=2034155 RepID=A0A1S8CFD2_9GAMM|nr:hypothetical protein BMI79_18235 [Serratia oryzae]